MASHNSTPERVLKAPKQSFVPLGHWTLGYVFDTQGVVHRIAPRRGKKVKRLHDYTYERGVTIDIDPDEV